MENSLSCKVKDFILGFHGEEGSHMGSPKGASLSRYGLVFPMQR